LTTTLHQHQEEHRTAPNSSTCAFSRNAIRGARCVAARDPRNAVVRARFVVCASTSLTWHPVGARPSRRNSRPVACQATTESTYRAGAWPAGECRQAAFGGASRYVTHDAGAGRRDRTRTYSVGLRVKRLRVRVFAEPWALRVDGQFGRVRSTWNPLAIRAGDYEARQVRPRPDTRTTTTRSGCSDALTRRKGADRNVQESLTGGCHFRVGKVPYPREDPLHHREEAWPRRSDKPPRNSAGARNNTDHIAAPVVRE
jgi:hypothetical protein